MIDFYGVDRVVLERIAGANIAPILYENDDNVPQKPYVKPEFMMVSARNIGLAPGGKLFVYRLTAKVVVESKSFNKEAIDLASQLAALFPFGLTLDAADRKLRVQMEPMLGNSYPTDAAFVQILTVVFHLTGR